MTPLKFLFAIVPLVVAIATLFITNQHWQQDKEDKERESQPKLAYVQASIAYEKGYTVLTVENESPVAPAAITAIHFCITDPATLERIKRKHPKPERIKRKHPKPHGDLKTSMNVVDDTVFIEGEWSEDRYLFSLSPRNHIAPSSVNDFRLAIVNPKWARKTFTGELVIKYDGKNSPLRLHPVTIQGRRRK